MDRAGRIAARIVNGGLDGNAPVSAQHWLAAGSEIGGPDQEIAVVGQRRKFVSGP